MTSTWLVTARRETAVGDAQPVMWPPRCSRCGGTGSEPQPDAADLLYGVLSGAVLRRIASCELPGGTMEFLCEVVLPGGRVLKVTVSER